MQRPPEAGVRRLGAIQPHHAIVSTSDHNGSAMPPRVGIGDTPAYTKTEPCRQYVRRRSCVGWMWSMSYSR